MLKTFFRSIILGSSLLVLACTGSKDIPTSATSHSIKTTEVNFNSPDIYKPMKGIYVFGEGVETFTPCGSNKDYWVYTYTDEMWTRLRDSHQTAVTEPYEGIYIEIYGWIGPKLHPIVGGEYAADFDGHIVIEAVSTMSKKSPADCK